MRELLVDLIRAIAAGFDAGRATTHPRPDYLDGADRQNALYNLALVLHPVDPDDAWDRDHVETLQTLALEDSIRLGEHLDHAGLALVRRTPVPLQRAAR